MGRSRVFGIDFSADQHRCGLGTWIAEGTCNGATLRILSCRPLAVAMNVSPSRSAALAGLRSLVTRERDGVFGLDFPFGLPEQLVAADSWMSFLTAFASRRDAESFREWCRTESPLRELKRRTDRETRTPFSPYNLRIYRQTYHGIASVLAPLVGAGDAAVLPMQSPEPDRAWVLEVCPASTLLAHGDTNIGYKGSASGCATRRAEILESLERQDRIALESPGLRATIVEDDGGDALDAILAVDATARALRVTSELRTPVGSAYALEGRVYT